MGGSGFTACFPFYSNVEKLPAFISETKDEVDTGYMYWCSRLIAGLTDAHYHTAIMHDDRYRNTVLSEGRRLMCEYDEKYARSGDEKLLEECNEKIIDMVQTESRKVLRRLIDNASEHMKTRFHRGDN